MVILFDILIALCILYTLLQFTIGLTEIAIGVTQIICALLIMAFIFLRRLLFGKRKQAFAQPTRGPRFVSRCRAHVRR